MRNVGDGYALSTTLDMPAGIPEEETAERHRAAVMVARLARGDHAAGRTVLAVLGLATEVDGDDEGEGKVCRHCRRHRAWTNYARDRTAGDGHGTICKRCRRKIREARA